MSTKKQNTIPFTIWTLLCSMVQYPNFRYHGDTSVPPNSVIHSGNHDATKPSFSKSEDSASNDPDTPFQLYKPDSSKLTELREELMLLIGELEEILIDI